MYYFLHVHLLSCCEVHPVGVFVWICQLHLYSLGGRYITTVRTVEQIPFERGVNDKKKPVEAGWANTAGFSCNISGDSSAVLVPCLLLGAGPFGLLSVGPGPVAKKKLWRCSFCHLFYVCCSSMFSMTIIGYLASFFSFFFNFLFGWLFVQLSLVKRKQHFKWSYTFCQRNTCFPDSFFSF